MIVVDVNYDFIGDKPEPSMDSIKRWRYSCGKPGWDALGAIGQLLAAAREAAAPIIYTTTEHRADALDYGRDRNKNFRTGEAASISGAKGSEIPTEIPPTASDIVISKKKASAFFGTPLAGYLVDFGVDTLLVTGGDVVSLAETKRYLARHAVQAQPAAPAMSNNSASVGR